MFRLSSIHLLALAWAISSFALAAMAKSHDTSPVAQTPPQKVELSQLLASPKNNEGKLVEVSGYYLSSKSPRTRAFLFASKAKAEKHDHRGGSILLVLERPQAKVCPGHEPGFWINNTNVTEDEYSARTPDPELQHIAVTGVFMRHPAGANSQSGIVVHGILTESRGVPAISKYAEPGYGAGKPFARGAHMVGDFPPSRHSLRFAK